MATPTKSETDTLAAQVPTASVITTKDSTGKDVATGRFQQVFTTKIDATQEYEVHVYDGPLGCGYVKVMRINKSGVIYEQHIGVGPESRDTAWQIK